MANIKSSAKRVLVSRVRAERNKADKSELKTTIKSLTPLRRKEIRRTPRLPTKPLSRRLTARYPRVCSTRTTQLARSPAWLPK